MTEPPVHIGHINLARGYRGGERQTELLLRYLSAQGWLQTLFARGGEELASRCDNIVGLTIRPLSAGIVSSARALSGVDLIHVQQGRALKPAWLQSFFRGLPYVVTRRVQKGPRNNAVNRSAYRRAAGVVAVSSAIAESLSQLDPNISCDIIPDASTNLSSSSETVAELRQTLRADLIVGHVGALVDSHKGQLQIIELAKKTAAAGLSISYVLVGSGEDEQWLREAAHGLENVHFMGQVTNVGDYLKAFDVFLYPSRHEGLGSILLDAMEYGLPVIATHVGGIPEIVADETNGFLCAPDDTEGMLEALQRLAASSELRESIGVANRAHAQNFTPMRMGKRYEDFYKIVWNRLKK